MDIKGKVIVVTGGADGIGRAFCRRFAREGAKVVTVADIDEAGTKAVADEINGRGFRLYTTDGAVARAALAEFDPSLVDSAVVDIAVVGIAVIDIADDRNDVDGSIAAWLSSAGRVAAVVRPDHYVFGSAAEHAAVGSLVADLVAALHLS